MSEIERGSQVRITLTGRYHHGRHNGHWVHIGATPTFIPATAEIEVLSPPLPPEPEVGRYAEVRDSTEVMVYQRREPSLHTSPGASWWSLDPGDVLTWAELHARGTVTVLTPAGETPRYEQATRGGMVLWQHGCGSVTACGPSEDPARDDIGCEDGCLDPEGPWTRLYRGVRSDG